MHQSAAEEAIALLASERAVGPDAFDVVARALLIGLECRSAGVARRDGEVLTLLTFQVAGDIAPLSEYPVAGSVCTDIYELRATGTHRRYSGDLAALFPDDTTLQSGGSTFYCAEGVYDEAGDAIGHLFVVGDRNIPDDAACRLLFRLASQCVSAKLNRQRAATALVQSERRFKDFAEAASDWFWELDADLRFSYFSERAYQSPYFRPELLIGKTRRELIEANDAVIGHGTTREDWQHHIADLEAHRPFHDFRHSRPNEDGETYYLSISGKPVFDASGNFQGYRGSGTNITERVAAENARTKSELRFRDFAESASDWFWEMDENLRFSYLSERLFEATGVRPERLLGKTRREVLASAGSIVGGDALADEWEWHIADLEAHRPFHDFRHPRPNPAGGLYHLTISGRPVFDSAGNFKGYRGSGSNITKQVLTDAALRKSEQRFRDFAEAATDWLWEMDENLRISGFSERYYQTTGVQPGEMIGLTRRDLLERNPDLVDDVATEQDWERHIADLEAHRPVQDFRHSRPKPTGEILYVSISAKPVFDEGGNFEGYRGSGTNITNQMRTEMALRESESQLRLQSERAEEASRAKSEFLANMSHEIRTPLNAVLGFSDSMRNEILGPLGSDKYSEYASAIHESGLHLLDLVNDILDLAKIESGTFSLSRDAFDLREIIDDCLQMTHETANRKEILLTVEADGDRIPVIADLRAMKQILLNLLSNALKYTENGGSVVVAAQADADGLTLSVRDTGIGIPERDISALTEAFVQGRTDEAYLTNEGTGLGLAITDSLVKLHGGSLTIDSVVGEGSTVSIRFPSEIFDQAADLSIAG